MKRKRNSLESKSTMTMAASYSSSTPTVLSANVYLPDECWEYIFKFLINHDFHRPYFHLEPLSMVSKQFLLVTNRLQSSLTIYNPTCQLFHRFSNISSLDLSSYHGDLDHLLVQISRFPLNITSLNISNQPNIPANGLRAFSNNTTSLTSLICSNISTLHDFDLLFIADCFPLLEELDISKAKQFKFHKTTFLWAHDLSLALSKLRKVNLSKNYYIPIELLFHLFKNCKLLQEVSVLGCSGITLSGIAAALRERPTLRSLSFSARHSDSITSPESLVSLKGLTSLDLFGWNLSDEFLCSVAMEALPFTRLDLPNWGRYSYTGIFSLLSKCRSIQHLNLQNSYFLTNQHVADLSLYLGDLMSINLSLCKRLKESALFALVSNCPSLIEIKMECTSIGKKSVRNSNSSMDCILNHQLKSLYLGNCKELRDETIIMFSSIFSNLQLLDLNSCQLISDEGINQVLRRSCNIRHLNLAKCLLDGMNFELSKLEVLNLSYTTIHDEILCAISKGCRGLLQLNLENCRYVTWKGVKYVVENCTKLREINLRNCDQVHDNVCLKLMLSLRPSLRKIVAPPHCRFTRRIMKLFSDHGCRVY